MRHVFLAKMKRNIQAVEFVPRTQIKKKIKKEAGTQLMIVEKPRQQLMAKASSHRYNTTNLQNQALVAAGIATSWAGCELDPSINTLLAPQIGDDIGSRESRRIQVLNVRFRGQIVMNDQAARTTGLDPTIIRILLVGDLRTNGVQLNAEDVMSDNGVFAFTDLSQFGKFQIYKDKTYIAQDPNLGVGIVANQAISNGRVIPFKLSHTFKKPFIMNFNAANAGNVTDVIDNSLHLIGCASNIDLAPTLTYNVRSTFVNI